MENVKHSQKRTLREYKKSVRFRIEFWAGHSIVGNLEKLVYYPERNKFLVRTFLTHQGKSRLELYKRNKIKRITRI